jgi:hypothetical protein
MREINFNSNFIVQIGRNHKFFIVCQERKGEMICLVSLIVIYKGILVISSYLKIFFDQVAKCIFFQNSIGKCDFE